MQRTPLDAERLRRELASSFTRLDVVETTGSTNADLIARAVAEPDADRQVLLAELQESGRGRHARAWGSPPRTQISVSILVRLAGVNPEVLGWLPLLTGIAVVDAVRTAAGVPAELKWPNDVLVGGRKLAGILAEVALAGPDPAVVVGVGLNAELTADELPVPHATSLVLEGATVDRTTMAAALLTAFAGRFTAWRDAGWDTAGLAAAYRERCGTLGARVRAELPGGRALVGIATDIDAAGRLLVGSEAVSAGDVTHLRPDA
ncbi:biotin--[acetyl-CoA-carboxylase] ligase [Nocardia sp. NPDC050697]|uniref:biotin--[acetyl-CoA-carboxylase] ligase n=1 Tax=Nocardia sp. NPDC050697 TaxID=3155158 RepID=UPI0033E92931